MSWLFAAAQAAKGFLVPLLLFFFASGGAAYQIWAAIFIIPVTVSAMLRYVVFRYRLGDDELVVRDGILTRTERHIPYARIQNIDLVQNPFHRLLDVALVRVETASGTKPEAVIRVLSLSAIDEMRAHVFAGRGEGEIAQTAPDELRTESRVLVKLPAGELAKLGIVSNKGLVVVAAALGLVWQTTGWEPDENPLAEYFGTAPAWLTDLTDGSVLTMAAAIAFLVIVAVVLLRMLSVGWFLVQLYGFTLRRRDDDLRAEYGLFTRISRTIPTSRIQTLTTTESALHRLFGRQSVELRTVGGGGGDLDIGLEGATPKARNQWLAPMVETARVSELLTQVLPEVDLGSVQWEPLATRAWLRVFRRLLALIALVAGVGATMLDPWFTAPALAVPLAGLAYVHARLFVKHARYALTPWGVAFKSGWWDRTVKLVRYSKIQTVARAETLFDRRNGMASVRVDTAGAETMGYTIDIPYLDADVATGVTQQLYDQASRQAFRW